MNILGNKWVLLTILALTWGSSFILIKKALGEFTPYQVGALRVGIAGLALCVMGIPSLKNMPRKTIFWAALAGFLGNFAPMFLFPMAETTVSSSIAGILNSLVPVFVLIFGFLFFQQKSTKIQVLGALMGFAGAYLLMASGESSNETTQWKYALLIVLATAMYGLSALLIKKHLTKVPSLQLSSAVFTIWLGPSLLILAFTQFHQTFQGTGAQWEALGYVAILGFMGTAMAMVLFYKLIQQSSAVFAASVTYLMPLVAVFWGIMNNEPLHLWHLVGGALILIGVYLIREKRT